MRIVQKAFGLVLAALLAPLAAHAEGINTWAWQTGNNSNWVTAGNWSLGWAPTNGEIAVINNAKVTLTNDTADLGGLIVTNGAILSVYSPLTNGATQWGLLVSVSGTVSVAGNAWIYPYSQNTNGGSAWFRCLDLVVGTNSGFNASEKGFRGALANENGVYNPPGYGPGRSLGGTYGGAGAGYGGRGGYGGSINSGNSYGSYSDPVYPGSGSGGAQAGMAGGSGGGLIRIIAADSVLMDGSLLANGEDTAGYAASGSGGGIYVKCRTFEGTGKLSAIGGNDSQGWYDRGGGGGGGGRIAVVYDSDAQAALSVQPTVVFNATGGGKKTGATWYTGSGWVPYGGVVMTRNFQARPGSVYLTDNRFFDLGRIQGGEIVVPGVTSWSMNTLSNSQGLIAFPANFSLTVTQDVVMTGAGGIDLSNSTVTIGGNLIVNSDRRGSVYFRGGPDQKLGLASNIAITMGWVEIHQQGMTNTPVVLPGGMALNDGVFYLNPNAYPTSPVVMNVGRGVSLTNNGLAYFYSGMTATPEEKGLVFKVGEDINIASNCWIYPYSHPTNGGSVWFQCSNLVVVTNGGFDANAKGFTGGTNSTQNGFGTGRTIASATGTGGAGYGGKGGPGTGSAGGITYGSVTNPTEPGSGAGGGQTGPNMPGGAGGGLIRVLVTNSVIMDGSLLANGQTIPNWYAGPGSGGGIYVKCNTLRGSGLISAVGGDIERADANMPGAGGGGRIAVVYDTTAQAGVSPQPTVRFNAAGGNQNHSSMTILTGRLRQGGPGSIYLPDTQFFSLGNILGGEILVPGATSWTTNALAVSTGWIKFPTGFSLTVSQDVTLTAAGGLDMSNAVVTIGRNLIVNSDRRAGAIFRGGPDQQFTIGTNLSITKGYVVINQQGMANRDFSLAGNVVLDNEGYLYFYGHPTAASSVEVDGYLLVTNKSLFYLYSGETNGASPCGLLVDVKGAITVTTNSWIYPYSHPTNGGSVHFQTPKLTVSKGGGIDANLKGYGGGYQSAGGSGPGGSQGTAGRGPGGAGYGGMGARGGPVGYGSGNHAGGISYGNSNNPVGPGSGAGGVQAYFDIRDYGTAGGGLIHVLASDTVLVDGSLLANGGDQPNNYPGCGSGGGIFVDCKAFAGSGVLKANGGSSARNSTDFGGSGGGGRIAVWFKSINNWSGTAQANGGVGVYAGNIGTNGTVVFFMKPPTGTMIMVN
jgi:hypothetical protein